MKFLVADDHELVLDAVGALLQSTWPEAQVSIARTADETAVLLSQSGPFDLALLDLNMPGFSGMADLGRLMKNHDVRYAVLSGFVGKREAAQLLADGAFGIITKAMSAKSMIAAVQLMISGQRFTPMDMPSASKESSLTGRELDVLKCLHQGKTNKEIARSLSIQETTVKLHLRSIAAKLDARNRTEVVVKALKAGLL
jgi:two-component system, NarL family, nitrate/nitrite response regulator NarL